MFEQTNQTETAEMDIGAAFESGIGEELATEAAAAETPAPPPPETYTVKYNGKEVDLTLDELKTRAQMGMNYDHVKDENNRIKESQLYKTLSAAAKKEGVPIGEYADRLVAQSRKSQLEKTGMAPEAAKQYAQMEEKYSQMQAEKAQKQPYLDFVRKFPHVAPEDIPQAVWERFHVTGDLTLAYTEAENAKLKSEMKAIRKNSENAQRAIGSLANSRGNAQTDAFLEGLLGG